MQLSKIGVNAQDLITNMSEIIWSMNSGFDTLDNLIAYCRRYSAELFLTHNIPVTYSGLDQETKIEFSGERRRHLFLVFKELLHNIIKHSEPQKVLINWELNGSSVLLRVKDYNEASNDDNFEYSRLNGNGIDNIKSRIEKLNGYISWKSDKGTQVDLSIPLSI